MAYQKKKYLLLYLKTGAGHLAPASAVAKHIEKNYDRIAGPLLIDGLEKTNKYIKYAVEDGYRTLQAKAKWYYEFLYAINKFRPMAQLNISIISFYVEDYIRKVILNEKPEKIIIFHFFLIQPVYKILKKEKLDIPVVTVVTDPFTAHPMWFFRREQNFILFSERLKKKISKRIDEKRIKVFPFILDEKFSKEMPADAKKKFRESISLNEDEQIILILGGGDGIPHGERILKEILKAEINAAIIIVCGRNKQLYSNSVKLQNEYSKEKLFVYGFVDFIYELINISRFIVTKCGASGMMEILLQNKVPVVNDYIWEQEKGNIEFLKDNKFGIYEPEIKKLPDICKRLIEDEEYYLTYKNNIISARIINGTPAVAKDLVELNDTLES